MVTRFTLLKELSALVPDDITVSYELDQSRNVSAALQSVLQEAASIHGSSVRETGWMCRFDWVSAHRDSPPTQIGSGDDALRNPDQALGADEDSSRKARKAWASGERLRSRCVTK